MKQFYKQVSKKFENIFIEYGILKNRY